MLGRKMYGVRKETPCRKKHILTYYTYINIITLGRQMCTKRELSLHVRDVDYCAKVHYDNCNGLLDFM